MGIDSKHDDALMARGASRLMDLFIRAGMVLALVLMCYRIFSPFLTLMIWALILAVTLFPLQQLIARRIGGRQGLASTLVVLMGFALIVTPTAVLMNSMADSIQQLINDVQENSLEVPAPRAGVAKWPLVGERLHAAWTRAHADLPAFVQSLQPKIGDIAKSALGFVAGIGVGLLMFLAAFIVSGDTCDRSTSMPIRFISCTTSFPKLVSPPCFAESSAASAQSSVTLWVSVM